MFADIAHGHTGPADVLFLVAAIIAGVTAVVCLSRDAWTQALGYVAVCLVAVAWLLL